MAIHASLPTHLGFIVDGNRRWAKAHNVPSRDGHAAGYAALKTVLLDLLDRGVPYVSVYAFSTENWSRSKDGVEYLMALFLRVLHDDAHMFVERGVRVRIVGSRQRLGKKLVKAIDGIEVATANMRRGELLVCLNYGGQQEIVEATAALVRSGIDADSITTAVLEQFLYAPEVPPCDMIVRTGGERRLSNFMLWRSAYSELMFVEKYWPDMTKRDVTRILKEYASRTRRFGG